MKHFLFLTLLFFTVACDTTNTTSTDPTVRHMPFDNSAYISIPHQEGQSILRRKLLNLSLTNQLKKAENPAVMDEEMKIQEGDEFNFTNDAFQSSSLNLEEYKTFKSNAAEVVVSYQNRLEIYFVPTGIARNKAFTQLGVIEEADATFTWVESPDDFLVKGKVYYLLSSTKTNLKENDGYYNQQKISLGEQFNEKILSFSSNQIVELELNVNYFLKETYNSLTINRPVKFCTLDMRDAEMCNSCSFKLEKLTGGLINKPLENSDLIDLDIIINEKKYPFKDLNPIKAKNGNFIVTLNLKKMSAVNGIIFQIRQNPPSQVFRNVAATEVSSYCRDSNTTLLLDMTPVVKMNAELNVKGRSLDF